MYRVVGCSHCESVKIVEGNSETTTCNRCQKQIDMRSVRVIFQSDSLEEAKEARSLSMAKRNGFDYLADEMVENEVLDDSVAENIGDDIGGYSGKDVPQDEEAERRLGSSVGGARDAAENRLGDIGVDERMEGNGVDKEEVRDAGERKETREKTTQDSDPKKRIVRDAVEFLDEPTDDDIIEFAQERGVEPEKAQEIVDKLCMEGEAMRTREGTVRLV